MKIVIINYEVQEKIEFHRKQLTAFDIEEQIYIFWKLEPCSKKWDEELYLKQKTLFHFNDSLYLVSIEKQNDEVKISIREKY